MRTSRPFLYDTLLPADSIECLPTSSKDANGTILSLGTYKYDEASKTRSGFLKILKLSTLDSPSLELVEELAGPGVLDVCWRQEPEGRMIRGAWASSDGRVQLSRPLKDDSVVAPLAGHASFIVEADHITMSCDLSMREEKLAAAMSSGSIGVLDIASGQLQLFKGHSLEAWTVTIDSHHRHLLFSGGDDGRWRGWDPRGPADPIFDNRWHAAGVCSIQPHPVNPHMVLTGSYDKRIALWDRRNLAMPLRHLERAAESGVWKLRWHPSGSFRVLAACMYDGFYVFDLVDPVGWESAPLEASECRVAKYDPKDLSYGCAWLNESAAVTCSFYNHQLQIWSILESQ